MDVRLPGQLSMLSHSGIRCFKETWVETDQFYPCKKEKLSGRLHYFFFFFKHLSPSHVRVPCLRTCGDAARPGMESQSPSAWGKVREWCVEGAVEGRVMPPTSVIPGLSSHSQPTCLGAAFFLERSYRRHLYGWSGILTSTRDVAHVSSLSYPDWEKH